MELPAISIYLFLIAALFGYIVSFWASTRDILKNEAIFDIAFITFFIGILVDRVFAVIRNYEFYNVNGWSFTPVVESVDQTLVFSTLPWNLVRLNDGNLTILGLFLGIVLGIFFVYRSSNKQKTIFTLLDKITPLVAANLIFLAIYNTLSSGELLASGTYQLAYLILLVVIYKLVLNKLNTAAGYVSGIIVSIVALAEGLIHNFEQDFTAEYFQLVDTYQIGAILLLLFGIGLMLSAGGLKVLPSFFTKSVKTSKQIQDKVGQRRELGKHNITNSPSRFAVSYANRNKNVEEELSTKEQMTRNINKIRRRLS